MFTVEKPSAPGPKQIPSIILHRIHKVSYCISETRGLLGICMTSNIPYCICNYHAYFLSTPSLFSAVCNWRQSFEVCHTAFWPSLCSQNIYKRTCISSCLSKNLGHPGHMVSRRPSKGLLSSGYLQTSTGPFRFFRLSVRGLT